MIYEERLNEIAKMTSYERRVNNVGVFPIDHQTIRQQTAHRISAAAAAVSLSPSDVGKVLFGS